MKSPLILTFAMVLIQLSFGQSTQHGVAFANAIINRYQPTLDVMTHKGWDHSNSIVLSGMANIYLNQKNPDYLAYIMRFVDDFVDEEGHISSLKTELDGIHPGVLLLFLYQQTGQVKYKMAATQMRNFLLGTPTVPSLIQQTPDGGYWHKNNDHYTQVMTIDGAYMSNPFLVKYGVLFNDEEAINAATFQTLLVASRTFNIHTNLPYHGWDYSKTHHWANPITGTSTQVWSRSIGWFSMALVDILEYLPPSHPHYNAVRYLFQQMVKGIKHYQNPENGLWYQVVTDWNIPGNYPETSGSGMLIYALAKGVRHEWIDDTYQLVYKNGWMGLQQLISVHSDGEPKIESFAPGMGIKDNAEQYVAVRPVNCPSARQKQHPHGYCAILMAASELEKLNR